jgi:hypothetical protein
MKKLLIIIVSFLSLVVIGCAVQAAPAPSTTSQKITVTYTSLLLPSDQ